MAKTKKQKEQEIFEMISYFEKQKLQNPKVRIKLEKAVKFINEKMLYTPFQVHPTVSINKQTLKRTLCGIELTFDKRLNFRKKFRNMVYFFYNFNTNKPIQKPQLMDAVSIDISNEIIQHLITILEQYCLEHDLEHEEQIYYSICF